MRIRWERKEGNEIEILRETKMVEDGRKRR